MPTLPHAPLAGTSLLPGFDDPVEAAQQTFRAALDAMAHPGRIHAIDARSGQPAGLSPAMTALLLTLADADTPVWLPPAISLSARAFLRFHCGCPLVDDLSRAAFVAVPAGHALPPLSACAQGDPAYPDRSATLLVEVQALGHGPRLTLRGPGIDTTQSLFATGLPDGFANAWRANHARFPLGVDLLLTSGARFCALPRTTHVED